jgi:hypothetical protein
MLDEAGSEYWAGKAMPDVGRSVWDRIDAWFSHVRWSGMLGLWQATHRAAYAGWHTGGEIYKVGKDGRYRKIEANEFRNLLMHHLNMVTGQRLHFDAQAKTTDYAAQEQTLVANGLAETCVREKGLERVRLDVAEDRSLCGEGWGLGEWDFEAGEVHSVDVDPQTLTERPLYTGDAVFKNAHPLDVARDFQRPHAEGAKWYCVRRYENVWDLAAAHPEHADELLRLPRGPEEDIRRARIVITRQRSDVRADEIPVWYFYHDRCPALPQGRWIVLASDTLALTDDALPYRELPVHRSAAMNLKGTIFGYTLYWDLLPLVQALNGSLSSLVTRMSALGVPNIWMPDGSPLAKTKIGEGLNLLEGGTQPPQLVDLGQLPPDVFKLIETIRNLFATYSGINDVARGFATDGVKAASALALLEARAMQFVALDQKADVTFMEQITSGGLHNYQDLGVASYIVKLTGKANRYSVREFVGRPDAQVDPSKKVTSVDKITGYSIRIGNPLQETNAGRMQMADSLAQAGMLKKSEDYIQVLTTGRIEPALEATQREEVAIVAENEMLARGEKPTVGAYDKHPSHIIEHFAVTAPPEAREDEAVVQATTEHVEEHITLWRSLDPAILMALGIPPAPMPPMPGPPPGPPGMPPPGPGGPGGPGGPPPPPPSPMDQPGPPEPVGPAAESAGVNLPPQPNNPMTGAPNGAQAM